jgi:nicotinate phosphoribosyltransferase
MGFIADNYGVEQTTPLMTDKYHFTTAYAYWLEGRADNPSVFYMFGRKEALNGGYTVASGLEGVIDVVKRWQEHGFSEQDIAFIRSQKTPSGKQQFPDAFIDYLKNMEFKLKIDAAPEGAVFFPQEPVIRVEGPIAQVKMLESVALGLVNGHSGYATHAARQSEVVEKELENGSPKGSASVQGLRRGPSLGAAIEASRSLGLGGYTSSSTGTAAKQFGQVFAGTMDHAWVMTHEKELGEVPLAEMIKLREEGRTDELQQALKKDAFRSFVMAHPESGILLVDTYDPLQGLENAITVIKELREQGLGKQYGVRFDSGDIVKYSKIALRRFAEEGFVEGLSKDDVQKMDDAELLTYANKATVFCAAADGIDEHSAKEMRDAGAFFKSWGVGTAGSHVAPLGLVYKAASVYMDVLGEKQMPEGAAMTPVMKVAAHAPVKSSNPGRINSRRFYDESGKLSHVVLYDESLGLDANGKAVNLRNFQDSRNSVSAGGGKDLLVPVFNAKGEYVYQGPSQKESFPGSGKMVTDLAAMAKTVKSQLDMLPEGVRRVDRPRDEVLQKKLLAAFKSAEKSGQGTLSLDVAALKASLPPEVEHIPVFLDQKLFDQRMECEQRHLAQSNRQGVAEYTERFEGGNAPFAPGVASSGTLQIAGGRDKKQAIQ